MLSHTVFVHLSMSNMCLLCMCILILCRYLCLLKVFGCIYLCDLYLNKNLSQYAYVTLNTTVSECFVLLAVYFWNSIR